MDAHLKNLIWFWSVALAIVAADQLSKIWALNALGQGQQIKLVGEFLGLVLVHNAGASFSLGSQYTWVITVLAVLVSAVVIYLSRKLNYLPWALILGAVLGGAVGNLIDRLLRSPGFGRGHVVDFIDYNGAFVGNVADIAIVIAGVAVVWLTTVGRNLDGSQSKS